MAEHMIHPGPRSTQRRIAVPCGLRPIAGTLPAGISVMEGVAALFAAQGCTSGVLSLDGLICRELAYVLPARSTDGLHAAWYSDTHHAAAPARIGPSTAMVGWRDGAPFLHCHGLWQGADGSTALGHLLPFDTITDQPCPVTGLGLSGATLVARPDPETAFTLFTPEAEPGADLPPAPGLLVRLLPGEDVVSAIEGIARTQGITRAALHGIGSIDHLQFEDGSRMECLATELRLAGALLQEGRAHIPVEVVDISGTIARGVLSRGRNPVGVTMELLIEPLPG